MSTETPVRDCCLVLLVLNEINGLRDCWEALPLDRFSEVVAVDGGSTDGSREFLTERGIPILDQSIPGRGVAFRVAAEASSAERMVFYSPDGNEDPADIERLDDLLLGGARVAIASRFAEGSVNEEDVSPFRPRAWANRALTRIANVCFNDGQPFVTDTINGFRALRRADLLALETTVKRFPIEYQISIRALQRGWPIAELATIEGQRVGGESKALSWPVGKDHLKVLITELPKARWWQGNKRA